MTQSSLRKALSSTGLVAFALIGAVACSKGGGSSPSPSASPQEAPAGTFGGKVAEGPLSEKTITLEYGSVNALSPNGGIGVAPARVYRIGDAGNQFSTRAELSKQEHSHQESVKGFVYSLTDKCGDAQCSTVDVVVSRTSAPSAEAPASAVAQAEEDKTVHYAVRFTTDLGEKGERTYVQSCSAPVDNEDLEQGSIALNAKCAAPQSPDKK